MSHSSDGSRAVRAAVDPRGPRVQAAVTAVVLAVVLATGWWALLVAQAALFALGAVGRSPYAPVWRVLRPRLGLAPPTELEDARPLAFAQALGLVFSLIGLAGTGTPLFTAAVACALAAAVLNAAFGLCLGCELYLRGLRLRAITRHP
jgi:hypothetical protein